MKRLEYFEKWAKYWAKRLKIGKIEIYIDNQMWGLARVDFDNDGSYCIIYNYNKLRQYSKFIQIHAVFHELGHIKKPRAFYEDYQKPYNQIMAEYIAENRALKWLKKYYPRYYKILQKDFLDDINYTLTYPRKKSYYFIAYSQIPEYAKHL